MSSFQAERWRRWIRAPVRLRGEMMRPAACPSGHDEGQLYSAFYASRTASLPSAARFRATGSLPPWRFGGGAVPATRAVVKDIMTNLRHRDGVLQLDEAAARMLQRGLDRKHHARLERTAHLRACRDRAFCS